ncbi:protein of unknown function [Haloechinothrix alba]|uniref:DUF397 domain-containing protein n=1 Tax=Haloechinothrix alba TaxID=664784 RepID=A0A238V1V2_9PSEU|nr:DUF397 domain-containing protein [Haloechinothrix alba]SNR27563.1 protein of unknown function [Haloechinothrix alba]
MATPNFTRATWITSSYSAGNGGNCVEVALTARVPSVGVRDSKDRDAGYLAVPSSAWRAFLRGVTPS